MHKFSLLIFLFVAIFVGSIKSDKFHYTDCIWAERIKKENKIVFKTREEARQNGYIACKVCRP
jgi:methylphosphotriester-DNA--protein-cysteine methyltransferase